MTDGMTIGMKYHFENDIEWVEVGQGEAVLFLHAMAGSSTAWQPQLAEFSKNYRCIAWDMPGFGRSTALADNARMDETVASLERFVTKTLELKKLHFVGLSVGGMILQHFAVAYPELIKSMTILDSSPKFGFGGDMQAAEFVDPILADLNDGKSVASFSDGMIRAIVGPDCSEAVKQEAIQSMSRATVEGLKLTTQLIGEHDALEKLAEIKVPTLVMAGADDADTPPDYAREIAARITDAQVEIISQAGHLSNLENPEEVNRHLRDFLDQHN